MRATPKERAALKIARAALRRQVRLANALKVAKDALREALKSTRRFEAYHQHYYHGIRSGFFADRLAAIAKAERR